MINFEKIEVVNRLDRTHVQVPTPPSLPCHSLVRLRLLLPLPPLPPPPSLARALVQETIRQYGVNYDKTWIYDKIHHEINQFCSAHTLEEACISLYTPNP